MPVSRRTGCNPIRATGAGGPKGETIPSNDEQRLAERPRRAPGPPRCEPGTGAGSRPPAARPLAGAAVIHGCLRLGRQSLLTPQDFEEAETVCGELGLGELLKRMPAGLLQLVGETGWQLSRSRALLQEADLVILDESFAALDPENLRLALECVAKRARAVLAITHP